MTKEECIADLKSINATGMECIDYAIKALEQQPSDDCVSRQAVIEYIEACGAELGHDIENESVREDILNMPPVTPTRKVGKWIETAKDYYKAINEKSGGVDENTPYFDDDIACPNCLSKFSVIDNETERFKCCPNCGSENE